MPVYRLTPVQGTESSPQWRASSIRPHCLWVLARDEYEARREVAEATVCQGVPEKFAPWKDSGLVSCEYDDSKDVAGGIICIRTNARPAGSQNTPARLSA
jgi:hypothetical protein